MADTADRRSASGTVVYIDCDVPQDMTLREWRCRPAPGPRPSRLRAAAAAFGRAVRLRRNG
jgi:hypothetical protein